MSDVVLPRLAQVLQASGYAFTTVTPVTPATHARVNARPGNGWARSAEDIFGEELAEPAYADADADRIAAVLLTARKAAA